MSKGQTYVGDMIELAYGRSLSADNRQAGSVPVYGSNGIVGYHNDSAVDGPGIVVGRKGSVGALAFSEGPFWPIDTTYFVVNKGAHDWRFLYHFLRSLGLTGLNSHSAVPGLNREDVYSIGVSLPAREEEPVIGQVLDEIEGAVAREDATIGSHQKLKRAVRRELFTVGLRGEAQKDSEIGPVPEGWDVRPVSDATKPLRFDRSVQFQTREYRPTGKWPIIDQGQKSVAGYTDDERRVIQSERPVIIFGDHTRILKFLDSPFALGADGTKPLTAQDGWNPRFLYHALCQLDIPSRGYNRHFKQLAESIIPKPSDDEQIEIAQTLDVIDAKINLHMRKKAVLEELFRALLHKLMTGEIHVADLDLAALEDNQRVEA